MDSHTSQPIVLKISQVNGKTAYRVLVGVFDKSADATTLQKAMKAAGVDGFVKDLKTLA